MLTAATIVMSIIIVVHSVAGELLLLRHLPRFEGVPKLFGDDSFFKQTLRATWHNVGIIGAALTFFVARASGGQELTRQLVLQTIAISFFASAALWLVLTRARHPGWFGFLLGGALVWAGA